MKTRKILSLLVTLSLLLTVVSVPTFATEGTLESKGATIAESVKIDSESVITAIANEIDSNAIEEIHAETILTEAQLKKADIVEDQNVLVKKQLELEAAEAAEKYQVVEEELGDHSSDSSLKLRGFQSADLGLFSIGNLAVDSLTTESEGYYRVATANSDGSFTNIGDAYSDFPLAKSAMKSQSSSNAVVLDTRRVVGNQVVAMKNGVVVSAANKVLVEGIPKSTLVFYMSGVDRINTYVENGIDAIYYDSSGSTVEMGISGQHVDGVTIEEVELVPMIQGLQSYYTKNANGELVHYVARYTFNSKTNRYIGKYESFTICEGPSFMVSGTKYYSLDGETFYKNNTLTTLAGTFYPYYKYLPFRSKTSYTAAELNRFIGSWGKTDSVLKEKGETFIKAQNEFGINGALLLAFAAHESSYGTSSIAKTKFNLFCVNATDNNPYGNAFSYTSVDASIYSQAEYQISRAYGDANKDGRYFGVNVGSKKVGMNVKYASDPYWGEKIAGHMYRLDKYLGKKDNNKYQLAITNKITNAKKQPSNSSPNYYSYSVKEFSIPIGIPVIVVSSENGWYKVQSDMGIDTLGTTPASYETKYDFALSKAYVASSDFTLINGPAKYIDPALEGGGNSTPVSEKPDTNAPIIGVKAGTNTLKTGAITTLNLTVTITDASSYTKSATKNGTAFTWPTNNTFNSDGRYVITALDAKGNTSTFSFVIDKTKPSFTVKSTVNGTAYASGRYTNTNTRVSYSDTNYSSRSATKNGKTTTWPANSIFKTDGKYVITVKDKAGNSSTFTFTIDKIKPKVTVKTTSGSTVKAGGSSTKNIKVSYSDTNYSSRSATRNGKAYTWPSKNIFTSKGKYVIKVKDKAGNSTVYKFTRK